MYEREHHNLVRQHHRDGAPPAARRTGGREADRADAVAARRAHVRRRPGRGGREDRVTGDLGTTIMFKRMVFVIVLTALVIMSDHLATAKTSDLHSSHLHKPLILGLSGKHLLVVWLKQNLRVSVALPNQSPSSQFICWARPPKRNTNHCRRWSQWS